MVIKYSRSLLHTHACSYLSKDQSLVMVDGIVTKVGKEMATIIYDRQTGGSIVRLTNGQINLDCKMRDRNKYLLHI